MKSIVCYIADFVTKEFILWRFSLSSGEGERTDEVRSTWKLFFCASLRVPIRSTTEPRKGLVEHC